MIVSLSTTTVICIGAKIVFVLYMEEVIRGGLNIEMGLKWNLLTTNPES